MTPRFLAFVITAALATMTAGCDEPITNHPTGPNSTAPAVNGVEINGPATLAPGQSARFTASIRLADGTLKTAEPNAIQRWRIGNPSLLQADHFGIMTAQPRGATDRCGQGTNAGGSPECVSLWRPWLC